MPLDKIKNPFSEDLISFIGKDVCDGFRFLHEHEICFNYLNKESVWLRKDGSIVLYNTHHMLDLKEREGSLTDIHNIRKYWSPEVSTLLIYL